MITSEKIATLYRLYPVLSKVDERLVAKALSATQLITLKAGTAIFEELQPCNAFPFVLVGEIRVFKQSATGRELSLYHVTPGDACVVTAGCLLGDEPYNASGQAKSDSILVMMPADDFEELLSSKIFREFVFSLFSKRVLDLMQLVEEVAFQRLDKRLAALLLQKGPSIMVSHQELANELGTVREIITKLLNSFSDSNLVDLRRGRIDILDAQGIGCLLESNS